MTRSRSLYFAIAVVIACCGIAGNAGAQHAEYLPVLAGTRVRVTPPLGESRVGNLVGATADSLIVEWDSRARDTLARSTIRVEVRSWRRAPLFVGATTGLVAGVASAGMLENAQNHCDDTPGNYCPLIGKFGWGISKNGYAFGTGGVVLGLLVGATLAERWKPLGSSVTAGGFELTLPDQRHGVGVRYALKF